MLVENDSNPVEGLAYTLDDKKTWEEGCTLEGYDGSYFKFRSARAAINMRPENCAKVTELDPNKSPHGCPELEPWMAYVGMGALSPIIPPSATLENGDNPYFCSHKGYGHFYETDGSFDTCHHFIDVRTEWAQEHFPEHCRIRNFQEPDAFEEFCEAWALDSLQYASPKWFKGMMKQAYELGQANPTK